MCCCILRWVYWKWKLSTAIGLIFNLLCFCLFLTGFHYQHSADATGIFVWVSDFRIYPSIAILGKEEGYVWILGCVYFIFQVCSLLSWTWILRQIVQYSVALHSIPAYSRDCIRRYLGKCEFVISELRALRWLLKFIWVQESIFILKYDKQMRLFIQQISKLVNVGAWSMTN